MRKETRNAQERLHFAEVAHHSGLEKLCAAGSSVEKVSVARKKRDWELTSSTGEVKKSKRIISKQCEKSSSRRF
jgi:hypothetical protein